jgi:ABC-type amino acid transport substrate-binding protein
MLVIPKLRHGIFFRIQAISVLTLALMPFVAEAQSAPYSTAEIEYAYPSQSVWTTRRDANDEPYNPLLRLAKILFQQAGIPWHGAGYPAARMFENLRNGKSEFAILVKSPDLNVCCLVSKKPVASTELRIYRRPNASAVKSRDDLVGKRVITILGFGYGGLLPYLEDKKNAIVNQVAKSHESAFAMLERGRADYVIDYSGPSTEVLAVHPVKDLKFDVLERLEVHLVLSRKRPDALQLMARLEAIAESLNKPEILWSPSNQ